MISPDYCVMMARYAAWQNTSLVEAADGLSEEARTLDRGAFFGSIMRTFSHLLWGDTMWLSRLGGGDPASGGIPESTEHTVDWEVFKRERVRINQRALDWANAQTQDDLAGDYSWFSPAAGRQIEVSKATCVVHMFNHGTHHRGQIHAMLTAAGGRPDDTDLPFMPTI